MMTSSQIKKLAAALGFTLAEMAKLLGLSTRTLNRGVRREGTTATLLLALERRLLNPRDTIAIRALAVQAVRSDGLLHFLDRLLDVFIAAEFLRLQQPNAGYGSVAMPPPNRESSR